MLFSNRYIRTLEAASGAAWLRQNVIAHNIANEDTPGYKAKRVDFESYLKKELSSVRREGASPRESIARVRSVDTREYELGGQDVRIDGNNVDIDSEFIEQARLQIQYDAVRQKVNGYYSNLKYVISGGR